MKLNLARSWRSKTFDEMVGQDLAVRILKNSLYSNKFFPVYLFSGQRGCGKTTAARIFASAVNCEALNRFQQDPKSTIVPCLSCTSCKAMASGQHPDFIEIDAASHTGVDHVRQIIDAASLLPVLASKKIYLIDEAHMLSKAAFNAFLKLLEEPPRSVFFILATTDPHKILETVISRCFQLFFRPVPTQLLVDHLVKVCTAEEIAYEIDGLHTIAQQSEGSVRDALNLLEQVRFSCEIISREMVAQVLGKISHEKLNTILRAVLCASSQDLLQVWQQGKLDDCNPYELWNSLVLSLCDIVTCALGAEPTRSYLTSDVLHSLSSDRTAQELLVALDVLYTHEPMFLKTNSPHTFLKYVLLKIVKGGTSSLSQRAIKNTSKEIPEISKNIQKQEGTPQSWNDFLSKLAHIDDPLVISMFKRATFVHNQDNLVTIQYPKNLHFFKDILESTQQVWLSELHKVFGASSQLIMLFDGKQDETVDKKNEEQRLEVPGEKKMPSPYMKNEIVKRSAQKYHSKGPLSKSEKIIDVSDSTTWQKAHLILKVFPGTVTEITEDSYG